jgi:amino-acid N-acetyltransferase
MNVAIGPAAAEDLPVILDLLRRSKLPVLGFERHLATAIVAREGERIVGCAAVEIHGAGGLVRSLAVELSSRGLGLGHQLTEAVLALARARAVRTVYLLTESAPEFFAKLGFTRVTRNDVEAAVRTSDEFTSACPADAVVMRMSL